MRILKLISLILILIMTSCGTKAANPNVELATPAEFQKRLNEDPNAYLLDTRKPDEFEAGHLVGTHLLDWLDNETFKEKAENLD